MFIAPICSAWVAELMFTSTSHVIASSNSFNNNFTVRTLSVIQVVLKEVNLIFLALALMLFKIAFITVFSLASIANSRLAQQNFDYTITCLFRAKFKWWIIRSGIKIMNFNVFLSDRFRKVLEKICLLAHYFIAFLFWTKNLLKHAYFIENILVKTMRTKKMFTIA